ncbi:prepilin-type N-terminal cleavage/methylation domain-containing protein [Rhodopirellula halodulae]|uniref:prepilin-type N-terminal cleavage/methylation domain-containing protein n=1 Tax=Rhodopirellula halodulae TaxID=2894198 RepID=UPI002102E60E|nr:prepilin-type N-terminal cleavage/methylation domain-containing protein [Rhodopirellula sp. JC737]MCC9655861.1 prepilin-type N-terminal cleavage/methylation domain-containing protein [Rhodopirellula sp. JC737]
MNITSYPRCLRRFASKHSGFTLVEMLIAMAVTLLMMAAVARAFAFVGARIRESRANVQLSNDLRDITTRISDEGTRRTVKLTPNLGGPDQAGYFLYHEGPVTDATSSLFRAFTNSDGSIDLPDSRYGDFDDYVAFTAIAPKGSWFTGKVPRYILEMKAAEVAGTTYTLPADDPGTPNIDESQVPFEPVMIQSRFAEIVYFASPEYPNVAADDPAYLRYTDVDGDFDLGSGAAIENGLPDRLKIHRRVLLIRPDLNLSGGALPIQNRNVGGTSVPFMRADVWPVATTATVRSTATTADGWAYGLAGIHQQCDLSIRRVLNASGNPTISVAANSLEDLSIPHNRFGHVRIPNSVLTGSGGAAPTSMPVLALSGPATVLNMLNLSASTPRIAPPLSSSGAAPVVTPSRLCGFIRREFVLGDNSTHLNPGTYWGGDRRGEDVVVNNALSFDVKIFDPNVALFATTTGLVVSPSDAGYRETLLEAIDTSTAPVLNGDFVDLCYPVLAGGSLRGWQPRYLDRVDTTAGTTIAATGGYLFTPFSGLNLFSNASQSYSNSLYRSGRVATSAVNTIALFQPAFDTYTSHYEKDGLQQGRLSAATEGTRWATSGTNIDRGADGIDGVGIYSGGAAPLSARYGPDDLGERETQPPFLDTPEAIQISVRLENPATRQIRQASVTLRD